MSSSDTLPITSHKYQDIAALGSGSKPPNVTDPHDLTRGKYVMLKNEQLDTNEHLDTYTTNFNKLRINAKPMEKWHIFSTSVKKLSETNSMT